MMTLILAIAASGVAILDKEGLALMSQYFGLFLVVSLLLSALGISYFYVFKKNS